MYCFTLCLRLSSENSHLLAWALPRLADGVDWLNIHPSTNHNDSQRFTSLSCIESRYLRIPRQGSVRSKIVGMTCSCSSGKEQLLIFENISLTTRSDLKCSEKSTVPWGPQTSWEFELPGRFSRRTLHFPGP